MFRISPHAHNTGRQICSQSFWIHFIAFAEKIPSQLSRKLQKIIWRHEIYSQQYFTVIPLTQIFKAFINHINPHCPPTRTHPLFPYFDCVIEKKKNFKWKAYGSFPFVAINVFINNNNLLWIALGWLSVKPQLVDRIRSSDSTLSTRTVCADWRFSTVRIHIYVVLIRAS